MPSLVCIPNTAISWGKIGGHIADFSTQTVELSLWSQHHCPKGKQPGQAGFRCLCQFERRTLLLLTLSQESPFKMQSPCFQACR